MRQYRCKYQIMLSSMLFPVVANASTSADDAYCSHPLTSVSAPESSHPA